MSNYIERHDRIFYPIQGDPMLGRGSFRVTHPGQLAVPLGQPDRQPHQGVVPVEGQGQTPQEGPDVVPVGIVGQLVGQHVPQGVGVFRRPGVT